MNINDVVVAAVIMGGLLLIAVVICGTVLGLKQLDIAKNRAVLNPRSSDVEIRHPDDHYR
jgi:hypothetical protein